MLTFYVICILVGFVFALLSFVFSGAFESHVDGGMDVGMDGSAQIGMDGHGDIAGGDAGLGEVHFPLFSPVVLASFITAFGAGGALGLMVFGLLPVLSLLPAIGAGLLVGLLVGFVVMKIYKVAQTNAVTTAKSLLGQLAEVVETIPASGVGEIAYSGKSSRASGPARSENNCDIQRHALVTITRVVGGLYYVREHVDEKLRKVSPESTDSNTVRRE